MRVVLAFLLAFGLGCRKVVQVCPEPPLVFTPMDPVDVLNPKATPAEIVKAYAASRLIWRSEAARRADLLDAYRRKK